MNEGQVLLERLAKSRVPRADLDRTIGMRLTGYLCRCTGYIKYHEAVRDVILSIGALPQLGHDELEHSHAPVMAVTSSDVAMKKTRRALKNDPQRLATILPKTMLQQNKTIPVMNTAVRMTPSALLAAALALASAGALDAARSNHAGAAGKV